MNNLDELLNSPLPQLDMRDGANLVNDMMVNMLVTEEDKMKMKAREIEDEVFRYVKEKEEARTSEIADEFNISYPEAYFVLERLDEKGKIVMN